MALLLAPYNESMRIGMGFNSYTQQVCVNDVVRKKSGVRASEADLRPVDPTKGLPAPVSQGGILTQPNGTIVKRRVEDGQADVSQVVSWDAGIVDNVSDVNKSLNISGNLAIRVASIGGGGSAQAHYVDSNKFLNADAKYSIVVKVTNQKLEAEDVTEFMPIPNIPAAKFTDVYGDSFISGFIEGGVLSALIMKTMHTSDEQSKIGGQLNVDLSFTGISVLGEAKADVDNAKKEQNTSTQISVSWQGGGDIKGDQFTEWNLQSLTRVAMEFADRVAICPQRTYAILTKYSSLRSFHEQTVKGSPLDYEIAGIYTSALLDSYMEYKAMWADLSQMIKDIERGTVKLRNRKVAEDKLLQYKNSTQKDYEQRMAKFNEAKNALAKTAALARGEIVLEEPLPANDVKLYDVDTFGLDKAWRDCRFEMIKIVREVNQVTEDPKVATDPNRNFRYLSPSIFRMLLPEPLPSPEEIAKMKADLAAKIQELATKQAEVDAAKVEPARLAQELGALREERQRLSQRVQAFENSLGNPPDEAEITFYSVMWGGVELLPNPGKSSDSQIEKKLTYVAGYRAPFKWEVEFFMTDPRPGQPKDGSIVYKRRGEPLRVIVGAEGTTGSFVN
ncbi:hypothetical protein B0H63DRAFT_63955 [Podospora didyma]|uniref:Uncharacterized protein n=1 Tax=Podospora didyma TaxID=330526 RepID=A0AAE0P8A9_9PEZI|nr:hypothetical protein B0H63DRAFT_63955 [Podospora didyma]